MGVVEPRKVSRRNRRAWWARFTFNGITRYERGTYDLVGGEELSDAERDQLLELCRQRLDAFREQRGEEVFAHRSRHRTPISGSIKVRVLTRAKGRCECCGAGCCLANPDPVTPGHSLVIPRRHVADGLALHQPEWNAVVELLKRRREQLSAQDASISGWAGSLFENRGVGFR